MNRLVLIDGNAVMHRAYHALPPLTSPDGKPAHVVYGFVSMMLKIFQDLKPTHMAVAFDRPGPTFRNALYADYQIQRPKMEDDFISQIAVVHDTVAAFGIPAYEADGFEADDVIGTISRTALTQGIDQVVIVTGDRDILQLVEDDRVLCYMPTKGLSEGKLYGESDVVERLGVRPSAIADFKSLAGDSSDHYPGVPGIGPKTAITLLARHGSVERLYAEIDTVQGKTAKAKLIAGKESAMVGKQLATIRTDAPVIFDPGRAAIRTLNTPDARNTLEALHFSSLLKRLTGVVSPSGGKKSEKQSAKPADTQQTLF